jgi:transcription elongation factor Elf1
MPDVNGQLSQDEKEKIIEHVKAKQSLRFGHRFACPVCGAQSFTIGDHLVTPVVINATGVGLLGPSYPQAVLVCTDCGNTFYINVAALGLLKQ